MIDAANPNSQQTLGQYSFPSGSATTATRNPWNPMTTRTTTKEIPVTDKVLLPGQSLGNSAPSIIEVVHVGHRADPTAYLRSSKHTYTKKIKRQMLKEDVGATKRNAGK